MSGAIIGPRQAQMRIPPSARFLNPAVEFVLAASEEMGLGSGERERLRLALAATLETVIEGNRRGAFADEIDLTLNEEPDALRVSVTNKGVPVLAEVPRLQELLRSRVDVGPESFSVENLGRDGQRIGLRFLLDPARAVPNETRRGPAAEGEIEVRPLLSGEEGAISELFFNVYEYNYVNDYVYFPERIRALHDSGQLASFVGVTEKNEIVGHVGLVRLNTNPVVYEAALGVVDPRIKSRGLFSRIFQYTMDQAQKIPMAYFVFDFVTNHDYSQKLVSRYGVCDLALFVGCQTKETQASLHRLGLGEDPEDMDRYSLLLSVSPRHAHPFGTNVLLPSNIGETLGFALKPLGLTWSPAPRFDLLHRDGDFTMVTQPAQKAVLFDIHQPGKAAVRRLIAAWQQLLREGYQYAGVNVPLRAQGLGHLYDCLAAHGFFMGGFIPYRNSGELGFRFQALGPSRVAFEKIKVCTETGRKLLNAVRSDFERNRLI